MIMTDANLSTPPDDAAVPVALAYHQAWTSHDFEKAMTYIHPDIVCDSPAGRLTGAQAFRQFMGPFAGIATGARLIAAFGDANTALVMYDTSTRPVPDAPGAEYVMVADGRITYLRIIFDRLPFETARRAAAQS
jgi:SnoaL-like domain